MSSFGLHDEIFGLYDSSPDGNLFEDDLKELMKLQSVSSDSMDEGFEGSGDGLDWSNTFLEQAMLNDDPMMSDARCPAIKSEHSYCTNSNSARKDLASDMDILEVMTDELFSSSQQLTNNNSLPQNYTTTKVDPLIKLKSEPNIITVHSKPSLVIETKSCHRPVPSQQSLLKCHALKTTQSQPIITSTSPRSILYHVKQEPKSSLSEDEEVFIDTLPITPPSSHPSSDSEGGLSPRNSPPHSPIRQVLIARTNPRVYNPAMALYSQPIPTSGILVLTEEEKRTFISEGYPLPSKLPLSKTEERNLKKVRRKIKNKISAQESRRKKKEYMDQLEKKVEDIVKENDDLRKKCENFEHSNKSLVSQLNKLQQLIKQFTPQQVTTQTATCLMVMILCFAVFFGEFLPFQSLMSSATSSHDLYSSGVGNSYTSTLVRSSRTLTSVAEDAVSFSEPWLISIAKRSFENVCSIFYSSVIGDDGANSTGFCNHGDGLGSLAQ